MLRYTTTEAKAKFSEVVEKALHGEDIIVTLRGRPAVRVSRIEEAAPKKSLIGLFEGQLHIADDFDEWPEDIARAFGMID